MQLKRSSRYGGAALSLACLAVGAMLVGFGAPAGQAKPDPDRSIMQPGYVAAFEQVGMYARITGYVEKVAVDIGDRVKSGDVLAELAVPELKQELKQKEALVFKAQTCIARAKLAAKVVAAALTRVKAEVKEAEAGHLKSTAELERWKAEYERAQKLSKKGVQDQATVDEAGRQLKVAETAARLAEAKVKSAEAKLDEAAAKRETAGADIACAEAGLAVAKAKEARVSALVRYAVVRAPFDGVVIRRNAIKGALAGPPADSKAEPLFTVARIDRVRVVIQVPENDSALVVKGMRASIRFQALDGLEVKAAVSRTSVALDPNSRTLHVEIDLDNTDGRLRPGMYGNVVLTPKN